MADDLQIKIGADASGAISGVGNVTAGVADLERTVRNLQAPLANISTYFQRVTEKENAAADAARKASDAAKKAAADADAASKTLAGRMASAASGVASFAGSVNNAADRLLSFQNIVKGFAIYQLGRGVYDVGASLVDAGMQMQALNNRMLASVANSEVAAESMQFVRTESQRLGLSFTESANGFAGFSASALRAGLTLGETKKIFSDISTVAVSLHLSNAQVANTFMALEQMASKGTVQMQELKLQLGNAIPGAMEIAAKAMGKTNAEFNKMIENGEVLAADFLPKFFAALAQQLGGSVVEASRSAQAELNRLHNAVFELKANVMGSGPIDTFSDAIRNLTEVVSDPQVQEGLKNLATVIFTIANAAVKAAAAIGNFIKSHSETQDVVKQLAASDSDFWNKSRYEQDELVKQQLARNNAVKEYIALVSKGPQMDASGGLLAGDMGSGGLLSGGGGLGAGDAYSLAEKQTATTPKNRVSEYQDELNQMLMANQQYGSEAAQVELKFWQDKLAHATKGTAEYNSILAKVYSGQAAARSKDIQDYVSNIAYKQSLANGDFAQQLALEDEKVAYMRKMYGEGTTELQNTLRERQNMILKHNNDIERQNEKLRKDYFNTFMGMARSFNNSIKGMLQGTTTFRQAMANMMLNIVMKFVEMCETMVARWIATQIIKVTGAQAAEATITATETAGMATRGAAQTAFQAKSIIGSAATTFSGVFSNMSPTLGPLAAIPAGAAAAVVAAQTAFLPSFAVGAWDLPGDTLAQVHQGEMIIPRTFAEDLRSNGGGIGGGITLNIHATDAKSVARLFKNNGAALTGALRQQMRYADRNTGRIRGR